MTHRLLWLTTAVAAVLLLGMPSPSSAQRTYESSRNIRIDSASQCRIFTTEGLGTASIDIQGTWAAGNVEWYVQGLLGTRNLLYASKANSTSQVTSTTSEGLWKADVSGYREVVVCSDGSFSGGPIGVAVYGVGTGGGGGGGASGPGGSGDFDIATFQTTFGTNAIFLGTGADNVANTQDHLATFPYVFDGSTWDRLRGDATDGLLVNLGTNNDVTVTSGNITVSATNLDVQSNGVDLATSAQGAAIQTAVELIDNAVSGAGFNITQLGGATIPMITTQADDIALTTDALAVAAFMYCYDGTNLDLCRLSTGGAGTIDANTGRVTIATDDDVSDAATLFETLLTPAHDEVNAGNQMPIGGHAVNFSATPTAVAAADRTRFIATRAGIPFTQPGHPNMVTLECQVEDADGAQTNAACVSVSAGTKIVVTGVAAHCDGSTTAPTNVIVGFGAATLPARAATGAAGILAGFDGVPAGGGMAKGFSGGVLGVGADDEDVRFTMEDPAGGNCSVEVSYYTIAG